ncbi:EIN3-binding F-box protein 1-like [Typha angustifolia]|uniref:EIN3-binding F-box protein 1-like n=1 Tax=Typha angustifolia TaxID=59011 RepID=UPI003C2EAC11
MRSTTETCESKGKKPRVLVSQSNTTVGEDTAAISQEAQDQDFINSLPDECISHIFSFLPEPRDRCSCSAVSRRWFLLQIFMLKSDFSTKLDRSTTTTTTSLPRLEISRQLSGEEVTDLRLASILVGLQSNEVLAELCLKGSFPSPSNPSNRRVTDKGISAIARICNGIRVLKLWNCPCIGNKGISTVALNCNALEKLELANSPMVTDESLILVAAKCVKLSSITLDAIPNITNESLQAFGNHSKSLKSVALIGCPLIQDAGIISLVANLPYLAALKLASMKVGDAVLKSIAYYAKAIRILHLESIFGITMFGYFWIGAAKNLTDVTLISCYGLADASFNTTCFAGLKNVVIRNCNGITEAGLIHLTNSTQMLERLYLEIPTDIAYKGLMQALSNCSRSIRTLVLVRCSFFGSDKDQPFNSISPQECPLLQNVRLEKCRGIGDGFLCWLGRTCKGVKDLSLVEMESVTDHGVTYLMDYLRGVNKITSVDLTGCTKVGNRSVWAVTRECTTRLRKLNLTRCIRVTDRGFGVIGSRCPNLVVLNVSGCEITDEGVRRIADSDMEELQELSMAGCGKITDRSLLSIEMSLTPSLEKVNVGECPGLTPFGIDWFKTQGYDMN